MAFYQPLRISFSFELRRNTASIRNSQKKLRTTATQTLNNLNLQPALQYAMLCKASYHSIGFDLMIEDYVNKENGESVKSYAPVPFGSKVFDTAQLKTSKYCKYLSSLFFALETSSHFIRGSDKPVSRLTDNKSLIRFFRAETISPSL